MSSRFIANLCSPLDPIDQYDIALDRQVYFPGDVVSGTLTLATSDDVDAKAVNLELVGRASARYFSANQVQRRPAELAPHGVLLKHCVHIVRSAKRHPNVGALTVCRGKPNAIDGRKSPPVSRFPLGFCKCAA